MIYITGLHTYWGFLFAMATGPAQCNHGFWTVDLKSINILFNNYIDFFLEISSPKLICEKAFLTYICN